MPRFNTKPCPVCGTVTSVFATPPQREILRIPSELPYELHGLIVGRRAVFSMWLTPEGDEVLSDPMGDMAVRLPCRGCQRLLKARPVLGIRNPSVKCDARCTEARGFKCECSCGGRNHGAGYEALADVPEESVP